MLTMDEYKVIDRILANWLEQGDLIRVKGEVYQIVNIAATATGHDLVVLDNYDEHKIISIPDGKLVTLVHSGLDYDNNN